MFSRMFWCAPLVIVCMAACGEDEQESALPDASANVDATLADAAVPDAVQALVEETEPNNGDSATDINEFSLPLGVRGAIGEADDIDIFAVDLVAGELLQWTLASDGDQYAPHLAIAEASNEAPPTVGFAGIGETVRFHHFALKTGRHHFIVRDSRNVPAASSEHVGAASNQYIVRSAAPTLSATPVTLPQRVNASLAGPFDLAFLSFSLAVETDIKIEVFADRAVPSSDIDSRLSLYYLTGDEWLITNDDPAIGQPDSMVTGVLPPGAYRVIVDNVNPAALILNFEVDFALQ